MILAAYVVETSSIGFAPCWWPATSMRNAIALAKSLSEQFRDDKRYPNSFWVIGSQDKPACKFFRGERYAANEPV